MSIRTAPSIGWGFLCEIAPNRDLRNPDGAQLLRAGHVNDLDRIAKFAQAFRSHDDLIAVLEPRVYVSSLCDTTVPDSAGTKEITMLEPLIHPTEPRDDFGERPVAQIMRDRVLEVDRVEPTLAPWTAVHDKFHFYAEYAVPVPLEIVSVCAYWPEGLVGDTFRRRNAER